MKSKIILPLLALVLCLTAATAMAGEIKDRMIQRKPAIDALLAQGVIGENNIGLLEYRGAEQEITIVNDENRDRFAIYKTISEYVKASITVVGQRRAMKISEMAPPGTWLQSPEGSWYRK